jgi:hypothetical protein
MKKLHSRSNSTTWQQITLVQFNKIVSTLRFHLQPHIQTISKTIQHHMTWHQCTNYHCDTNHVSAVQEYSKAALRPMHSTERNNGYLLLCAVVTIYISVIMFILILLHVLCLVSWLTKRIFLISSHKQSSFIGIGFWKYVVLYKNIWLLSLYCVFRCLTLSLLMSYIYGAPSKARNANVLFLFAAQYINTESM